MPEEPTETPTWDVSVHMLIRAETRQEAENIVRMTMWETPETVEACRIDTVGQWTPISGRTRR